MLLSSEVRYPKKHSYLTYMGPVDPNDSREYPRMFFYGFIELSG